MQSSCKVIKSTNIVNNTLVSPPIMEKVFKNNTEMKLEKDSFNIEEIYSSIIDEAKLKAAEVLKNAESTAKNIIDSAEASKKEILKKAEESGYQSGYQSGYKDGYNYGINEALEEGEKIKNQAEEQIKNNLEELKLHIKKTEKEIIKLSVDIAKHIINTELSLNPDAVYKIAEKAITQAVDKKQVILKVNPGDFNIVKRRKDDLAMYVEDANNIFILADSNIQQGSVIVETPSGFVDASIDNQLVTILKGLLGE
ncbi:hypothetical protein Q428_06030 [Fervidicella metallireducens AeB]|uniref:Flagellar assembly protein FliH/Type III secretion system HrpE domain-containing protein n=1 Tax=Fervidicella metallireducens AeB TaxID=1403537 RepID=A0A017RVW3_9CLOT|nr:FliH/SctL family protein [Fervidicella metallireducens]EYE88827.1 hypothetical protein Q428_06030 [Fervidicella metallireducens AeB]